MLSDSTSPDAIHGSLVVVAILFGGYTVLSVAGIVIVKKWWPDAQTSLGTGDFTNGALLWSAGGALAYLTSFLLWMGIVTRAPLSVAYPVAVGATMCLTLVSSLWIFGERPTGIQFVGSGLVLAGISLIGSGLRG